MILWTLDLARRVLPQSKDERSLLSKSEKAGMRRPTSSGNVIIKLIHRLGYIYIAEFNMFVADNGFTSSQNIIVPVGTIFLPISLFSANLEYLRSIT